MKTPSIKNTTSKKRSTAEADHAVEIAFRELCQRASAETAAARARRRAEKHAQWQGAAKRFKGLSEALRLRIELRNIHANKDGYTVNLMRGGKSFTRHFYGQSDESFAAAIKFRDEALKILGDSRAHQIPARVLQALRLPGPVVGIARDEAQSAYVITSKSRTAGKQRSFSYETLSEEDAYAAAIEQLEADLKLK